ncbi:hypothetical protein AAG906_012461 [Vitis piasezkii]
MDATNRIYCYIFVGGKLVQKNDGLWEYVGGRSKGIHIYKGMTFEEFTHKVLEKFDISLHVRRMHYTLKFNPRVIQDLEDEDDLDNVVSHSDDFANVYIVESPGVEAIEANIPNTQLALGGPHPTFPSSNASCDASPNTMMLSRGFASRCADSEYTPLESNRFREAILVKCSVEDCPWKITTHAVEGNEILRVYTYQVNHNHIAKMRFTMGCRPVLAIDSCHLSGPYKGALLSAIAYDAMMECSSSLGCERKEDALLLLDNIAYARLDIDYNEAFEKLNSSEHWAMSKFLKKRWDKMTTNIAESFNAWLPCLHVCAVIRTLRHDVYDYIDPCFKVSTQHLIYSGRFQPLPTHNMPKVCEVGILQDGQGNVFPSLQPRK